MGVLKNGSSEKRKLPAATRYPFLYLCLILLAVLCAAACNQDPLFFMVLQEVEERESRVKGTPSNMVEFKRSGVKAMYVGSSDLHWYSGGVWDEDAGSVPQPPGGGKVIGLAVTDDGTNQYLFALRRGDSGSPTLSWIDDSGGWTEINTPGNVLNIFAAERYVFVGRGSNMGESDPDCLVSYIDAGSTPPSSLSDIKDVNNDFLLSGAAFDGTALYISAKDIQDRSAGAVYRVNTSMDAVPVDTGRCYMGLISIDMDDDNTLDTVLTMNDGGTVYKVNAGSVSSLGPELSGTSPFTGALGLYKTGGGTKYLLAGYKNTYNYTSSSSSVYGYRESRLGGSNGTDVSAGNFVEPSASISGSTGDRYQSTIGKRYVKHIFQTGDGTLFASTLGKGLWSYRVRDGDWQWNAEE